MFSGLSNLRHAVESVVENLPRGSLDLPSDATAAEPVNGLKKSLANGRANSPGPSAARSSPRKMNLNLEERLRARFAAAGESSPASTPSTSARTSPAPAPTPTIAHPISPSSVPLPLSPPTPEVVPPLGVPTPTQPIVENTLHSEACIPLPPGEEYVTTSQSESVVEPLLEEPAPEPVPESKSVEAVGDVAPDAVPQLELPNSAHEDGVEALRERLKLVEQRFSDVSTSFKRLQAEKVAADAVLREMTPVGTLSDVHSLRDYLQNLALKGEISQDEIKRLTGKLTRQEERIEELRDTHHLESASQSAQIEKLRKQHDDAQGSIMRIETESITRKADVDRLTLELEQSKRSAKEEEEKRVKAISLLKTVRQKLVKAEKDKDDVAKETAGLVKEAIGLRERETALREKDKTEREKEKTERARLLHEVEQEREQAMLGLRAQFDREITSLKERQERELAALRGQFELEAVTSKGNYSKELGSKNSRIASLETSVNSLSREKNEMFEQLQMRQAELESSQSGLESLESRHTELQHEVRELIDRTTLLNEELSEVRRDAVESRLAGPSTSAEDVARLLSVAEAKSEAKIAELRRQIAVVERERNENEAEWSRKLRDKARETEDIKGTLDSLARTRDRKDEVADVLKKQILGLRGEVASRQAEVDEMHRAAEALKEGDDSTKMQISELEAKIVVLEHQLNEVKSKESQTRLNNKTLREELRKVQSSAALLERQRNPGVGYWTSRPEATTLADIRTSMSSSTSDLPGRVASPAPSTPAVSNEEEVNLEYLRNVILQFLEHKEMRPNLVRVLSIILHFTPSETRRLIAKV